MTHITVHAEPAAKNSSTQQENSSKIASSDVHFVKTDSANHLADSGFGEGAHLLYAEKRASLVTLITQAKDVLSELADEHEKTGHTLRYPPSALKRAFGPKNPVRNNTMSKTEFASSKSLSSSSLTSSVSSDTAEEQLRVLQLDLTSYAYTRPAAATTSIDSEDHNLISQLLKSKILDRLPHLDRLYVRILDPRSKVLVTGDLNAGKSTLVNAFLRREIVPDDQQPCTALFVEVVDAEQNNGKEEVHGIRDPAQYDRTDASTYERFDFRHLRHVVEENEEQYELLKIYCTDYRKEHQSVLHNGIVDISLIDSPGLNIDSIKTTALFSQQEEIDAIVFVVNAENHFTLSGRDFLTTAGQEKAYIFIVVNRFDSIRRKDRCRRDILEQIRQISPDTFEDADNLVHFVSAKECLHFPEGGDTTGTLVPDFYRMEESLRTFILEKRARSKLAPAKIYLRNLLSDVITLAHYNRTASNEIIEKVSHEIEESAPALDRMLQIKEQVLDDIEKTINATGEQVEADTSQLLTKLVDHLEFATEDVQWNGPLYVWQYARDLRNKAYSTAGIFLRRSENQAREKAVQCLRNIENVAKECMSVPPSIDVDVVANAFEDDISTAPGPNAAEGAVSKVVPMEVTAFFDHVDKAELAKEYAPGLSLSILGLVGYNRMASQVFRQSVGGSSPTGKLLFAGLALAGTGWFLYALSDMKNSIEGKIVRKLREHFIEVEFVGTNVDRIAKGTRRVLRLAIWEFQNQFRRILGENQRRQERQQKIIEETRADIAFYDAIGQRAAKLMQEVDAIDLEETPAA
ncbi:P-loop containing nucleoside triphosphate hydrolase protein [Phlyctochytrium arcticum]|nr:P-loop containing nucleoside triphosphate hydrolase protein [Phlyctochytrium arcticum]